MTQVFHLPDLGEGLTDAQVLEWRVAVGDTVAVDQVVAVVETAKAAVDLPCPFPGRVERLHGEVGDTIAVGAPLVTVSMSGSGNVLIGYGAIQGPRRPRRAARREGRVGSAPAPDPVLTTAFGERGGQALLPRVPSSPGAIGVTADGRAIRVISPLVRRLAAERGIDLESVEPTGPGGIVTRRDVAAVPVSRSDGSLDQPEARTTGPIATTGPAAPTSTPGETRIPLTGARARIAATLSRSRREIPDATLWVDVDATGALGLRDELRRTAPDSGIGVLALLARIVVAGLARHPELNASVDVAGAQIVRHAGINLSFAVQAPAGLMVPVVHGAHAMTTRELAAALRQLTEAARAGRVAPAQLTGGTFTLNSFGVFGVDGSTPIINHPQAALLGVGRILDRPWVVAGNLRVRPVAQLSLTFDHRVCDGAEAGGFLRFVADCVERPSTLLAEL